MARRRPARSAAKCPETKVTDDHQSRMNQPVRDLVLEWLRAVVQVTDDLSRFGKFSFFLLGAVRLIHHVSPNSLDSFSNGQAVPEPPTESGVLYLRCAIHRQSAVRYC